MNRSICILVSILLLAPSVMFAKSTDTNTASILVSLQHILASFQSLFSSFSASQLASISGSGSGLVGYWTFDEGSGTTAGDSSGNNNNGTLVNGPVWTTGKIGGALQFDSANSQRVNGPVFSVPNTFTFSFWFKTNLSPSGVMVSLGFQRYCSIGSVVQHRMSCTGDGTANHGPLSIGAVDDGSWHHAVFTVDNNIETLYIDGNYNAQSMVTLGTNAGFFSVGSEGSNSVYFTGAVDDTRFYNRALAPDEITALYNFGSGSVAPPAPTSTPSTLQDTAPPTVSDVQTNLVTQAGTTISWTTDELSDSQLDYGLTTNYGSQTSLDSTLVTSHSQAISNLQSNTTYHYRVRSKDQGGNLTTSSDQTFTTIVSAITNASGNIYIGQTDIGSATGTDCSNTHSTTWFNAPSNWGTTAGKIGPGTTVHLCGTLFSSLTIQGSGTAGNPITILFEPNAKMSAPYWPSYGAIMVLDWSNVRRYITIDGGTNGIIETTDNGTAFTNQQPSGGVWTTAVDHFTVQNLNIRNLYVRTPQSNDPNQYGKGIYTGGGSYITVRNNTITNAYLGIGASYGSGIAAGNTVVIDNNTINRINWGITVTAGGGSVDPLLTNLTISNNRIDGFDIWETLGPDIGLHRDGIFLFNGAVAGHLGSATDINIFGNYIGPGINPQTPWAGTGGIWAGYGVSPSQYVNVNIYNNVLALKPGYAWANYFIMTYGTNVTIVNNTIVGDIGSRSSREVWFNGIFFAGINGVIKNNLIYLPASSVMVSVDEMSTSTVQVNNNIYYTPTTPLQLGTTAGGATHFHTFSEWKNTYGFDANTTIANPQFVDFVNGNYHLQALSPAVDAGTNMASIFSTDFSNTPRPQGQAWDIGAYEYCASNCAPAPIVSLPPVIIPPPITPPPVQSPINIPPATTLSGGGYYPPISPPSFSGSIMGQTTSTGYTTPTQQQGTSTPPFNSPVPSTSETGEMMSKNSSNSSIRTDFLSLRLASALWALKPSTMVPKQSRPSHNFKNTSDQTSLPPPASLMAQVSLVLRR